MTFATNPNLKAKGCKIQNLTHYCHVILYLWSVCLFAAAPEWEDEPVNQEKSTGEKVTFICRATSNPPPRYDWYINGVPLESCTYTRWQLGSWTSLWFYYLYSYIVFFNFKIFFYYIYMFSVINVQSRLSYVTFNRTFKKRSHDRGSFKTV